VIDEASVAGIDDMDIRGAIWDLAAWDELDLSWDGTISLIPENQQSVLIEPDAL